jgi:hypothetical protein
VLCVGQIERGESMPAPVVPLTSFPEGVGKFDSHMLMTFSQELRISINHERLISGIIFA